MKTRPRSPRPAALVPLMIGAAVMVGCSSDSPQDEQLSVDDVAAAADDEGDEEWSGDPVACREVRQHSERLAAIAVEEDATSSVVGWSMAVDQVVEIDEAVLTEASPTLRDGVWLLIDSAREISGITDWDAAETGAVLGAAVDSLSTIHDYCAGIGHELW